jgi:uncharacterized protein YciI
MRHFIIEISYTAPLAAIDAAVTAHRQFLQRGYDDGLLLMSGPKTPRVGGIVIARAESVERLESFFADDPYRSQGLAQYRFVEFTPVKYRDLLDEWCAGASR